MRLQDKATLITGAGSGIGRAMAVLFAREGARIVAADVSLEGVEETVRMIHDQGGVALSVACDVTVSEQVRQAVERCVAEYGRIDVLCNNAGVGSTQTVVDTPEEVWDRCFNVNVKGVYWGCKHAIPIMASQGKGTIVNTASVAGLVGIPNRAAYCASKGAVVTLTKAMAVDHVGQGIRVNCVCPGTVDSPWVARLLAGTGDPGAERRALEARQPMGRLGTPEEVALAALYLASDESAFVTGTGLIIDGGIAAR
ncbi:MAG TPA: SDR family oxidoreductase [Chloroflexota bacterium]|jgi:NAD(P)-dependent dehydrogenase (short-subunit alcohol dehydrogenase family)|nr:SDR family oxidoreductase [Chloroflexota bacterium]